MARITLRTTTTFAAPDSITVCGTTSPTMVYDNGSETWLAYEGESDGHKWELICTVCGLLLTVRWWVDTGDSTAKHLRLHELTDEEVRAAIASCGDEIAQHITEMME